LRNVRSAKIIDEYEEEFASLDFFIMLYRKINDVPARSGAGAMRLGTPWA